VEIIDALGQSISQYSLLERDNLIVLPSEIMNGIYFVRIKINSAELNIKIIKQN
jgi:hypothetical protein